MKGGRRYLLLILGSLLLAPLTLTGCATKAPPPSQGQLTLTAEGVDPGETLFGEVFPKAIEKLEARLERPDFSGKEVVEWTWLAPGGEVFSREKRLMNAPRDRVRLQIQGTPATAKGGAWRIEVTTGGRTVVARSFVLAENIEHWKAVKAQGYHVRLAALRKLCAKKDLPFLIGHYSESLPSQEKQIIFRCLQEGLEDSVPALKAAMEASPGDERVLSLAYQVKGAVVGRLYAGSIEDERGRAYLKTLLTRYDAPIVAKLLESPAPELRSAGVRFLGEIASVPAILALEKMLQDPDPAVRDGAAEELRRTGTPLAEDILRRRTEPEPR